MNEKEKIASTITGICLFLVAAIFSMGLLLGILDFGTSSGLIYKLGTMLVQVYGVCSILIPVFFFTAGIFCLSANWSVQRALCLLVSIIPFFTLVFAERSARGIAANDSSPAAVMKIIFLLTVAVLIVFCEYLLTAYLSNTLHDFFAKLGTGESSKASDSYTLNSDDPEDTTEQDSSPNQTNSSESSEWTLSSILKSKRKEILKTTEEISLTDPSSSSVNDNIWSIDTQGNVISTQDSQTETSSTPSESYPENSTSDQIIFEEVTDSTDHLPDSETKISVTESSFTPPETGIFQTPQEPVIPHAAPDQTEPAINPPVKTEPVYSQDPWNVTGNISAQIQTTSDSSDSDFDIIDQFESENQNNNSTSTEDVFSFIDNATESSLQQTEDEIPFDDPELEEMAQQDSNLFSNSSFFEEPVLDEDEDSNNPIFDELEPQDDSNDESAELDIPELDDFTEEDSQAPQAVSEISKDPESEPEKKTPASPSKPLVKSHSMLSALDSVFAKMDQDAKSVIEEENLDSVQEEIPAAEEFLENTEEQSSQVSSAPLTEQQESTSTGTQDNSPAQIPQQSNNTKEPKIIEAATPVPPKPVRPKKYSISTDLLTEYEENRYWEIDDDTRAAAANLMDTLKEFNIDANITDIRKGPVVTMFEMLPAPGVKLSKIQSLQDNIALRLAAKSVRIVAPIPGKSAVGIEIPNSKRAIVSFRECIEQNRKEWNHMQIPIVLGKDIEGESQMFDLTKTPHLLIAGSTGAGKSVCVNSMILSILYKRSPNQVKMILIDPKIVELSLYNGIGHLLTPVITEPKMAIQALQYCICEMERRYAVLKGLSVRDILSYNKKIEDQNLANEKLPYIVVVIDEFADLMATTGKQMEAAVARLAAKSRAVGIHLVLATQRPSTDVITGVIKANLPSRIAFMVSSKIDSRIIIDQMGADKLLGKGDMLYASATDPFPVRIQGTLVTDQEVENVVNAVKDCWGEPEYIDDEIFVEDEDDGSDGQMSLFNDGADDPLYDKALDIVVQAGKASASYIQRRLSIGYNRAARLVELMEERGIVGPANGSKPREILHMP